MSTSTVHPGEEASPTIEAVAGATDQPIQCAVTLEDQQVMKVDADHAGTVTSLRNIRMMHFLERIAVRFGDAAEYFTPFLAPASGSSDSH